MVRRGWSSLLVLLAGVVVVAAGGLAACSGGDDDGGEPPSTSAPTPATIPDDVEAGTGQLVLDGEATLLTLRACTLAPVTDPDTGVVTELAIDADDDIGIAVSITRFTTPGDVPTVSDVVTVADQTISSAPVVVEAERAETGGRYIDLLVEGALTPLLRVDGDLVTGEGVFGPPGARPGAEDLQEGTLIIRCPPAG